MTNFLSTILTLLVLSSVTTFGQKYNDTTKTDFSKEYYQQRTNFFSKYADSLSKATQYDFSSIWPTIDDQQNGVLGQNYQRIQFHIETVTKSRKNSNTYIVTGKTKVNNNICNFKGEIKLQKIFYLNCEDDQKKKCGVLLANYIFYEDSSQYHSGFFEGVTECSFYYDSTGSKMLLDKTYDGADGYENRTFVGTWTDYRSKQVKKCIWGDYRLPFTFGFDCGDGEMKICDEYVKNGWQSFNARTEYQIKDSKGKFLYKWW